MLHTITRRCPHQSSLYTITPNVNIVSLISPGTCIHPDTTEMAAETELAKQSLLINNIPKNSVDFVMRVLVIRRGSIIPYKNSRNEGTFRTIILVDEEGTKIQATLFNKHIETWKDSLKPNKNNTIIQETEHAVSTHKFSDGFLSLEHADKLPNGTILVSGESSFKMLIPKDGNSCYKSLVSCNAAHNRHVYIEKMMYYLFTYNNYFKDGTYIRHSTGDFAENYFAHSSKSRKTISLYRLM
ncbi:hypothetical protein H5410_012881 [Solanum commersonii]|uniref:Uncharacterized protein n=1 Tax=Solanum commersonii TaxID=4109 RepID=A0A9J6AU32_SOLCO|nr:hypothetical protein H5410_012881 [Solanum commersonii]